MKRLLATMLAAFIMAGVFAPMATEAATKVQPTISGGVHFLAWGNEAETMCYFYVRKQGVTSFQYRVYYNSGRLKKTGTSGIYSNGDSTKQTCKVEGLTSQACTYVSIRAYKDGAWTPWSSKYSLVPMFRDSWLTMNGNKYNQTMKISWKKITGTSAYDVYLSTTGTGGWTKTASTTGSSVTLSKFNGKKFKSGQTYYFKVVAKKKENGKWINSSGNNNKFRNGYFWFIY